MKTDKKKILVASLNWGLGHAVRDIPLINSLLKSGFEVVIAGEGASGELLKKEFPSLRYIHLPSFSIVYSKSNFFIFKLFLQLPKIFKGIRKEHKQLQEIIENEEIDIVISDNRYGLHSNKIPSVFITHQIFPVLPKGFKLFEKIICKIHKKYIERFDKCLIPDFDGNINLSGDLSHKYKLSDKYRFIGILSQFEKADYEAGKKEFETAVIISGPEPQRTMFEEIVTKQILKTGKKAIIVTGQPGLTEIKQNENITFVNHLPRNEMQETLLKSEIIISRSGYTTIMDLVKLQKKAILIPTPGQTEQEYLSEYLKDKEMFVFKKQNDIDLDKDMTELKKMNSYFIPYSNSGNTDFINIIKSL